jgi:CHAT domain-containing protein/tetratricopeptide (TPR) repeat protein
MTPRHRAGLCRFGHLLGTAFLAVGISLGPPRACQGQIEGSGDRMCPSAAYYSAFGLFYNGDYKDALDAFLAEGRGAIKTVESRWIDSICYHTMAGECYYHVGDLPQALEHYTSALKLFSAYSDWMIQVQFPPGVSPAGQGAYKTVPWGASKRQARLGQYPQKMLIAQGRIDNSQQWKFGGVVKPATLFPIQVQEIVRATTLAIRRRAQLMGPVSQHDSLTADVIAKLSRRPGPPNHWSECWIDIQAGLALAAGGKEEQALPLLQRSLVAAGQYDHPMTCVGLLALGQIALQKGQFPVAARFFEEATYAAVSYGDYGVLEEAFRCGAITHLLSNGKGPYPLLETAIHWAKVKDLRQLRASLLLLAAENQAVLGQTPQAVVLLEEAQKTIGRRRMAAGWIGARLNFVGALAYFQQKKIPAGNDALAASMGYMQHGSHWLFQIGLADGLYTAGQLSPRVAMDLYTHLLRDPQPADWRYDPMESMTVLVTPHPGPLEHWFEVAMTRREHETALEIAERIRRHRFFSSLAFGGRLESLRWILEAPPETLPDEARLQRQDLLAQHPVYDKLAQQARQVRNTLEAMPLVPADQASQLQQSKLLEELAVLSMNEEALLREIAVRREPAAMVFPPLRKTKEILAGLPKGNAILVFFATSRGLYGFLLGDQRYTFWQVRSANSLTRQAQAVLREMGHFEQNRELTLKELADPKWKQSAQKLLDTLLEGSRADLAQVEELVIVPDGLLWYVPFEALQHKVNERLEPLILKLRIRYAPTASLAVSDPRARKPSGNAAVVVGKLYPRDDESVARTAFEQLARVVPGAVALRGPLPGATSVYGVLFDRLIVLDDLVASESGPYGWTPVQIERNKPGNTLADWLLLPWGGPETIVLPGFHTAAENALKRTDRMMPGGEVFLSLCGLMSNGARTVLISRWRTGGQNSFDLVREFVQELPHTTPADAWQRAVLLAAGARLNLDAEPRIKKTAGDEPPRANHPFFWAGYLLVDSGVAPEKAAANPPGPAVPPGPGAPVAPPPGTKPQPGAKPQPKPDLPDEKPPAGKQPEPKRPAGKQP